MTIENLLAGTHELRSVIHAHGHAFEVTVKRQNTHLLAKLHYPFCPGITSVSSHSNLQDIGHAVIGTVPYNLKLKYGNIYSAYVEISEQIELFFKNHETELKKSNEHTPVVFNCLTLSEDYYLHCYKQLLSTDNLRYFDKTLVHSSKLRFTNMHKVYKRVNQDECTYYFRIEEDDFYHALKITIDAQCYREEETWKVINIELIQIQMDRDKVLLSAQDHVIDQMNQDLNYEPEYHAQLISCFKRRLNIIDIPDGDLPF